MFRICKKCGEQLLENSDTCVACATVWGQENNGAEDKKYKSGYGWVAEMATTKFETVEDCEGFIKAASYWLFIACGLTLVLGLIAKNLVEYSFDIIVITFLAIAFLKHKTRSISVAVFIIMMIERVFMAVLSDRAVATNVIWLIFYAVFYFKAMQAAFARHKLLKLKTNWPNFFWKTLIFLVFLGVWAVLFVVFYDFFLQGKGEDVLIAAMYCFALAPLYLAYAGVFPFSNKLKIEQSTEISPMFIPDEANEESSTSFLNKGIYKVD